MNAIGADTELIEILRELKNPVLIAGKALEHYKIRKSRDFDFLLSTDDFAHLLELPAAQKYKPKIKQARDGAKYIEITTKKNKNQAEFYLTVCGKKMKYEDLPFTEHLAGEPNKNIHVLTRHGLKILYNCLEDHFAKCGGPKFKKMLIRVVKDQNLLRTTH